MNIHSCSELRYRKKKKKNSGMTETNLRCCHKLRSVFTMAHVRALERGVVESAHAYEQDALDANPRPPDLFDPLSPPLLCVRRFRHRAASWVDDEFKRSR